METTQIEVFQTPPILFIFCWMGAMTIFIATMRWLWLMRDDDKTVGSLQAYLTLSQVYIFLGCAIFSIFITLYAYFIENEAQATIIPEMFILSGFGLLFGLRARRLGKPIAKELLRELLKILCWVIAALIGWLVFIGFGYGLYYLVKFLSRNELDYFGFALFVTGLSINIPLHGLHIWLRRRNKEAHTLRGLRLQTLLLVAAFGYGMLMVPLALQEGINKQRLHEMHMDKPIRKA